LTVIGGLLNIITEELKTSLSYLQSLHPDYSPGWSIFLAEIIRA